MPSNPCIAEIIMFGGNFAPRSWALCDGQLLPINQNQALFSILGTTYGGDGRTTFGLPDLRGRFAMHPGNGPGLTSRRLGEKGGSENKVLATNEIPSHNHTAVATLKAHSGQANQRSPGGNVPAMEPANVTALYSDQAPDVDLSSAASTVTVANIGGGQSFSLMNPFLCVNFIIALQGTFPSRS